nr:hypothetical protein GCM10020092_056610 [Actinoplanes digitatis]
MSPLSTNFTSSPSRARSGCTFSANVRIPRAGSGRSGGEAATKPPPSLTSSINDEPITARSTTASKPAATAGTGSSERGTNAAPCDSTNSRSPSRRYSRGAQAGDPGQRQGEPADLPRGAGDEHRRARREREHVEGLYGGEAVGLGRVAASPAGTPTGAAVSHAASRTTYSAWAPTVVRSQGEKPMTSSFTARSPTDGPTASTVPATSQPGTYGSPVGSGAGNRPARTMRSTGCRTDAATRTRT